MGEAELLASVRWDILTVNLEAAKLAKGRLKSRRGGVGVVGDLPHWNQGRYLHPTEDMKAILEFNLPEDQAEHSYAVAGVDALLLIDAVLEEIRNKLKFGGGFFLEWKDDDGVVRRADDATLERVRALIVELKAQRNLPELT